MSSVTFTGQAQATPLVQAMVDNAQPFVGEAIIYTLRILTPGTASNSQIIEPDFAGFGRAPVSIAPTASTETVNNVAYNVIAQSYILYPLITGDLIIEPFEVRLPETPFQAGITLATDPIFVSVNPYPADAPASFDGAIGQFDIEATLSAETTRQGDAINLQMNVSGTGNLEQVTAPTLVLPDSWNQMSVNRTVIYDAPRFGRVEFEWTLLVDAIGSTQIPPIEFSYLNPQTQTYETRFTPPLSVTVTDGEPQVSAPVIATEPDIQAARQPTPLKPITSTSSQTLPSWIIWLWVIPSLFVLITWVIGRPRQASPSKSIRKRSNSLKQLQHNLKLARELSPSDGFAEVEKALLIYLTSKTGQPITSDNVQSALSGISDNLRGKVLYCVQTARSGRYAPVSADDLSTLITRSQRVFTRLEAEL